MIGRIIFFMGRSASGKSTISNALCTELRSKKYNCIVIDADDLAANKLMPRLGDFSLDARLERAPYLAKIVNWLQSQFDYVIVAATGQPQEAREVFKEKFSNYTSIYLSATLAQCKERDYKGFVRKLGAKELSDLNPDEIKLKLDQIMDWNEKSKQG